MTEAAISPTRTSETAPSFGERVAGVLTRPRETFARMTDADAWYWAAVLLLIGYTLYYLANGVGGARWQTSWMSDVLTSGNRGNDPAAQSMDRFMAWVASASQLFGNVVSVPLLAAISWAVRTATFYGLARLLGGEKPAWGRVAAMVGWAWLPLFLQYCLVGALMLASPAVMMFFLPLPEQSGMAQAADNLTAKWHGQMLFYLSPFVFWNLALCVIGVAELFRLPRWKAGIVVLTPAVLQLGYLAANYMLSAALLKAFGTMPGSSPAPPGGP
ncbi:MAG: Yip1 family protein [Actinomycetota bacterium]